VLTGVLVVFIRDTVTVTTMATDMAIIMATDGVLHEVMLQDIIVPGITTMFTATEEQA
jgi:hypothetical protein